MSSGFTIRKAMVKDARVLHGLLNTRAKEGLLLPRSFNQLYTSIRDFYVAEDESGAVRGCCALTICWEDLAEIRSLVVDPKAQGLGLGRELAEACIEEARSLGLARVFTLTYVVDFFDKLGFTRVEKDVLPQKVWADCLNCLKFPECDEIAMLMHLDGSEVKA
ncbi:N-acetyltransferase [Desulfohalovibrio reitneri]|uniref:N-acetyltransferase n=1 Tax=Desulfohalovibrio reitneri TaxID=1307759 RepID=UPI0004A786DA|nr:N-acetyltransferase [Desulfohalovibrio reitneri]